MSVRTLSSLGLIAWVALAALTPVAANAGTKCKSTQVSIGSINEDQAIAAWSKKVKRAYGAPWSDFNLAKAKSVSEQPLPPVNMFWVSGYPCRRT
jgi:hypothetical protein